MKSQSTDSKVNATIERLYKVINDTLKSLNFKSSHKNLEKHEDNLSDYFLHSFLLTIKAHIT
jgi:hypothetical protein